MFITGGLTVIIATCNRPFHLFNCLYQIKNQQYDNFQVEIIVVDESDDGCNCCTLTYFSDLIHQVIRKPKQGACGAFAKDVGISAASLEYVCFFDDDNIYFSNAFDSLFFTAYGYDIGVVNTIHQDSPHHTHYKYGRFRTIPKDFDGQFKWAQIDTMCLCVKRQFALTAKWSDHTADGTDFMWLKKLMQKSPKINYKPIEIGYHLTMTPNTGLRRHIMGIYG